MISLKKSEPGYEEKEQSTGTGFAEQGFISNVGFTIGLEVLFILKIM